MFIGIISGETLLGPFSSRMSCWSMRLVTPPMPVPTTTATRAGSRPFSSEVPLKPASSQACAEATRAACSERSSRRACTRGNTPAGSTAIGAPMRTAMPAAHS